MQIDHTTVPLSPLPFLRVASAVSDESEVRRPCVVWTWRTDGVYTGSASWCARSQRAPGDEQSLNAASSHRVSRALVNYNLMMATPYNVTLSLPRETCPPGHGRLSVRDPGTSASDLDSLQRSNSLRTTEQERCQLFNIATLTSTKQRPFGIVATVLALVGVIVLWISHKNVYTNV